MERLTSLQVCQLSYTALIQLQTNFVNELNNAIAKSMVKEEIDEYKTIKYNVANCVLECYTALLKVDSAACEEVYRRVLQVYIDFLSIQSENI